VGLEQPLEFTFDDDLEPSSVNADTVLINDEILPGLVEYSAASGDEPATVRYLPEGGWPPATEINALLSSAIRDRAGNTIGVTTKVRFTTAATR